MKKFLSLLLAGVMAMSLAACGRLQLSDSNSSDSTKSIPIKVATYYAEYPPDEHCTC